MTSPSLNPDETTQALVRRLFRESIRPYIWRLTFAGLCMILVAATTAANAWIMQPVLDDVFLKQDPTMLFLVPAAILVIAAIKGFSTYGQALFLNYVGQRIVANIQVRMYAHLIRADLAFFHGTSTGTLVSRFTHDLQLLRAGIANALSGMVKDSLTLIFLVGVMFYQDWTLALITFVIYPVAVLPIMQVGRRMRKVSTGMQLLVGKFTALLEETFHGARHVKAYGMESHETARASNIVEKIFKLGYKTTKVRNIVHPVMELLGSLGIAFVVFYGGNQVLSGTTTPGAFFSFIAALLMAYQPMKSIANLNATLQEGLAAASRVFALLDDAPKVCDRADAKPLKVTGGEIVFRDVHFAYGENSPALHGVTLTVPAGKTAALVGPSGSGKSTILNLIPRFYDVNSGSLKIDGQDVRDTTLATLRRTIGLVSQEVGLFDNTVRENILYGDPDATDAAIVAAAKAAAADSFIDKLPEGYDTVIGERGGRLSGGQRQRIEIARAMLRNAPILLLDEATSALDTESERQVQTALQRLKQGRTTLVIAHRLSTVQDADIIYVIDAGRVVEEGTHASLLARNGVYARLYALQFENGTEAQPPTCVQV
ncbi:MAG: lipid A export permease/ATP-binding protein MsbA [Rhodospirillaceae bacterium]|nr:MAG: lipid A export permease/ATP-binding protein MsbA [Rhodospirillaceae bacterium]